MIYLKNITDKLIKDKELLKIYSHPRSGTHFLEAFIAKNFYNKKNLNIPIISWGHWSNRIENPQGNPYGKLFGNHYFADRNINSKPKIYIVRDGRAVAYSIWKTKNFIHKDLEGISFSDFLRTKIDWEGTPAKKVDPSFTILEHWCLHVDSWFKLAKEDDNLLIISYEDLIDNSYSQYEKIHSKFFRNKSKRAKEKVDPIKKPIGLLPNMGTKDSWKGTFNAQDEVFFRNIVAENFKYATPNHSFV